MQERSSEDIDIGDNTQGGISGVLTDDVGVDVDLYDLRRSVPFRSGTKVKAVRAVSVHPLVANSRDVAYIQFNLAPRTNTTSA